MLVKTFESTPSVIYDGTLSKLEPAIKQIDYALEKGKKVEINPLYTPPALSSLFNQLRPRHVPQSVLADAHFGYREVLPQLLEKYGNKITIKPFENLKFGETGKEAVITDLKSYLKDNIMSKADVLGKMQQVETIIKKRGLDFAKKVINAIL